MQNNFTDNEGNIKYTFTYHDGDPEKDLNGIQLDGVRAFCFFGDKFVVISPEDGKWSVPGGGINQGENYRNAMEREIKEETNMKVLHMEPMGYQDVYNVRKNIHGRQAIMFCTVEPIAEFLSDPDGDIVEMRVIELKDFDIYMKDWGEAGTYLLNKSLKILERINI